MSDFNRTNAVVVRVRVKKARASMKDEFLSDEICNKYGIDKSSARLTKDIFKMTDINRPISRIRDYLRTNGYPWSATTEDEYGKKKQDATWLFNGREVKDLADFARQCKEDFEAAVKKKADNWDDEVQDVRRRLGAAFRQEDLPTREEFVSQFRWETEITPLQDMDEIMKDYRMKLPEEIANEQMERYQRDLGTKVSNVVRDAINRVTTEVMGDARDKGLLKGLEEYDPDPNDKRKGNTYRDSRLYGNMNELREFTHGVADVFPGQPQLESLVQRLDKFCDDILPDDPAVVREDPQVRKRVIAGLRGLIDETKMPEDEAVEESKAPAGGFGQFV